MIDFNVNVTGGSQIAASLLGYSGYLETEMALAMDEIVQLLSADAQGNMHWMNPSGALEDSIDEDSQVIDAWHAIVGSSLPYAARRNWGFSGMTDSLGRYFPDDPGQYYLDTALDDNASAIETLVAEAAQNALHPLGV